MGQIYGCIVIEATKSNVSGFISAFNETMSNATVNGSIQIIEVHTYSSKLAYIVADHGVTEIEAQQYADILVADKDGEENCETDEELRQFILDKVRGKRW